MEDDVSLTVCDLKQPLSGNSHKERFFVANPQTIESERHPCLTDDGAGDFFRSAVRRMLSYWHGSSRISQMKLSTIDLQLYSRRPSLLLQK